MVWNAKFHPITLPYSAKGATSHLSMTSVFSPDDHCSLKPIQYKYHMVEAFEQDRKSDEDNIDIIQNPTAIGNII